MIENTANQNPQIYGKTVSRSRRRRTMDGGTFAGKKRKGHEMVSV
jgi:hypothetical protein